MYENPEGESACGFRELVIALAGADDSLFSTELVEIMCDYFLERYRKYILFSVFVPWCVYFLLVLFYMSYFAVVGSQDLEGNEKAIEILIKSLIIAFAVYFQFFEIISLYRDPKSYIKDSFNYIDFSSPINNIYCMLLSNDDNRRPIKILAALAVCQMWIKAFYWMRIFPITAKYVRLLAETLKGVTGFLVPYICIIILFADAYMILNEQREEGEELYKDYVDLPLIDSIMNIYLMSLGDFDTKNY